jgi:hypothetical protein
MVSFGRIPTKKEIREKNLPDLPNLTAYEEDKNQR